MATGFREKVERELSMLSAARREIMRRMHYSTVEDILRGSGLPYKFCQTYRNDLGESLHHGYRYFFTSKWESDCALYIQETFAGRSYASMGKAIDALEYVLKEAIRMDKEGLPARGIRKSGGVA